MQYLIYSNIVYGYLLKIPGLLFEGVNWYVVTQYILLTVAVISVFYSLSFHVPIGIAVSANILFWYAGFFEQIRRIQFTRTASVLAIAGFILIWNGCVLEKGKQRSIGAALCVLGSCIRWDCLWPCLAFFGILFGVLCFSGNGFQKDVFQKYVVTIMIVIGIAGALKIVDSACYVADAEWESYKKYNAVRAELLDFGIPDWETNRERYEEIGFTENDLKILDSWILEDPEKFGYETLKEIASWKEKKHIRLSDIRLYLKDFFQEKHALLLFDIWLAMLIMCALRNNICRIFALLNAGLLFGEYFCLYYMGRVLARAEYGILLSAIFSLAVCLCNFYEKKDCEKFSGTKWIAGVLAFYVLFLWNDYTIYYKDYRAGTADREWEVQGRLVEKLSENRDCVYVLNMMSFIWPCLYSKPYESPPDYYLSNFTYTGSWYSGSPFDKALHVRLGLDNPMKDLLYKENVYYVRAAEDGIETELLFFRENYKPDAQAAVIAVIDGYNIYQFY